MVRMTIGGVDITIYKTPDLERQVKEVLWLASRDTAPCQYGVLVRLCSRLTLTPLGCLPDHTMHH